MKTPKIRLLEDRVLLKVHEESNQTSTGIILVHRKLEEKPITATVITVGPELDERLFPGDVVQYRFGEGLDIELEGENYVVVRESVILLVNEPRAIDSFEATEIVQELATWAKDNFERGIPQTSLAMRALKLVYPEFYQENY